MASVGEIKGSLVERIFPFEGVLNNIDRRYKEAGLVGVEIIYQN